jgi:glycosyltransferase involved in cell wall biosynthesis
MAAARRKVFLVGTGPLPEDGPRELGFPALRTRQFLLPMLEAGHDVMLACLVAAEGGEAEGAAAGNGGASGGTPAGAAVAREREIATAQGPRSIRYAVVRPDEPGRFLMLRDLRGDFGPDVTVTAGPFLPMAAGPRAAGDEPLWVDIPGDPMSEAQARAYRSGSVDPLHRYREMLGWALARGDRFSVISGTQRAALLGALGLAGRLTGEAMGHEFVHVVPGSVDGLHAGADPRQAPVPERLPPLPADALVVLFSGGYNTWLDGETLLDGLLRAMEKDPRIHYVSTGGPLRGHDEWSFHRFAERAKASPHGRRFHLLGWVPTESLPAVYARADLGLFVDLPCYEAELGARTRVLAALERGLPVAATDSCETTHELRGTPWLFALPPKDPAALADLLCDLAERKGRGEELRPGSGRTQAGGSGGGPTLEELRGKWSLGTTTRPLLEFLAEPSRSPGGVPVDFLEDYWQELARLQDRLEEVWKSPTWRYLGRIHRLIGRLFGG